jgi:hypothetical protein
VPNVNATILVKTDPHDTITVEVGDAASITAFIPQLKVTRWGEVSFKAKLKNAINYQTDFITLAPGPGMEDGGHEFNIILPSKPATNVISFDIETIGLDFLYQDVLTQAEIDHGAVRPDNVIGSYAVYHSTNSGDHTALGGKNYKTGKAFHIYRPLITDAKGNTVWGDLKIDTDAGILSVTIPQTFLDKAKYPVSNAAGLTVGFTTKGGSTDTAGPGYIHRSPRTKATGTGKASKVSVWGYCSASSSNDRIRLGFYHDSVADDDSLDAGDQTGVSPIPTTTAAQFDSGAFTVGTADVVNGHYYWPGMLFTRSSGSDTFTYYFDSLTSGIQYKGTYSTMPDPFPTSPSVANEKVSLYVTYAPSDTPTTGAGTEAATKAVAVTTNLKGVTVTEHGAGVAKVSTNLRAAGVSESAAASLLASSLRAAGGLEHASALAKVLTNLKAGTGTEQGAALAKVLTNLQAIGVSESALASVVASSLGTGAGRESATVSKIASSLRAAVARFSTSVALTVGTPVTMGGGAGASWRYREAKRRFTRDMNQFGLILSISKRE